MKHLKYFEMNNGEPEIGQYVIAYIGEGNGEIWQKYINNSIGKIIKKDYTTYIVEYHLSDYIIDTFLRQAEIDNAQKYVGVNDDGDNVIHMHFTKSEIKKWTDNIEEYSQIKYNL